MTCAFTILGTRRWRCGSPPAPGPKEVATRAGHTSVSFTLDRYGHLYPDSYTMLRDRLDAMHLSAQEHDAEVIDLSSTLVRPQRNRNAQ